MREIIGISIAIIICNFLLNVALYYLELFIWLKILISVLFAFACGCVFIAVLINEEIIL